MREIGLTTTGGGNFSARIPAVPLLPPFQAGNNLSPARVHTESIFTTALAGYWGGGRADRNIICISKAASLFPGPGCLLKVVLYPQEPSWGVDLC